MLYHRKTRSKNVQMQARAVAVWGAAPGAAMFSRPETVGPKKREALTSRGRVNFRKLSDVSRRP